jgi:peptide/nickel transport system substrate-binding protein
VGTLETPHPAVGTGAYRVVAYKKGRFLEVAANPGFWGGAPAISRAVFDVLPVPAKRASALARREIQFARDVKQDDLGKSPNLAHTTFLSEPGLNVTFLGISLRGKGPLQQAKVRPAIFWALDPQELLRESGVSGAPCDQLVPESIFGYLPQPDAGRPRLEMAKSLLAEAGYPRGFETTLEMPTASVAKLGPMLTKQLARVGITLNTVPLEWRDLSSRLDRRESPFFTIGWACYGDASDLFEAMLHTRRGDAWGTANFGEYSNPQLDAVIELAGRTMEPAARLRALHEAMRLSLQDVPLIPLFQRKRTYGVDERLHFVPRQNGQVVLFELSWVS